MALFEEGRMRQIAAGAVRQAVEVALTTVALPKSDSDNVRLFEGGLLFKFNKLCGSVLKDS